MSLFSFSHFTFSSTLSARGTDSGGTIEVTGDSLILLNAQVDASGTSQGGTVHLGGGWQKAKNELFSVVTCDEPRLYDGMLVRDGSGS